MLHEAWQERVRELLAFGNVTDPRGQGTLEQLDQKLRIEDSRFNLLDVPERNLNVRFAVAEWLWMTFGRSDVESLAQYNSVMRQFSDDGVFLTGAYGPHIKAQLARRVLPKLAEDPNTRQAVIEIPRPNRETKDEPCTLSLQFLLRDGRLNLVATMRSSDVWLGIPYDVFSFTMLQNCLAGHLGVRRGFFSLHMGSSHLYLRNRTAAHEAAFTRAPHTILTDDLPGFPPPWLEEVLRTRDNVHIPESEQRLTNPWFAFARALLVNTSAQARYVLSGRIA